MTHQNIKLSEIQLSVSPLKNAVVSHPLFKAITTLEHLRCFMEHHVFAVWDFMSLLKYLQACCSCVTVPWVPIGDPTLRRLVNDIVLGEESDVLRGGGYASHYEMYLDAMDNAGASSSPIKAFVSSVNIDGSVEKAFSDASIPSSIQSFVSTTFDIIESDRPHVAAAAFTFGREDLIPDMFTTIVEELGTRFPNTLESFLYYLHRHIELDSGEHAPMALKLVSLLCGDDEEKWKQAQEGAVASLNARHDLWSDVLNKIT